MWHQLTDLLVEYTANPVFDNEGNSTDLIELYNTLIKDTHLRINPLKYALITISVARQFQGK